MTTDPRAGARSLTPGCAYDSDVAACHGETAAALLRVARRMREKAHGCKVGAARARNRGHRRHVAEMEALGEAMCHAEMTLRKEVLELYGVWPVDDQPPPAWPADEAAQPPAPTPTVERPPAPEAPLLLFDLETP
jgi:hypothetical protein